MTGKVQSLQPIALGKPVSMCQKKKNEIGSLFYPQKSTQKEQNCQTHAVPETVRIQKKLRATALGNDFSDMTLKAEVIKRKEEEGNWNYIKL